MPIKKKVGSRVGDYTVTRQFDSGANAFAYQAEDRSGNKVFLKQYKSPAPATPWFDGYTRYQNEIKRRIESEKQVKSLCYRFIEFFVEKDYFQVFEFVEGGMNLTECLEKIKKGDTDFHWQMRVIFARILMLGIKSLHGVGVVHTDLKPDNLYLLPDESIALKYKLRLIDLDFAILVDKQAPWVGEMGYMGTPGYRSPEHLGCGGHTKPLPPSDIFTCGIMLSELLCGGHPYRDFLDDEERLKEAIENGSYLPCVLEGDMANADAVQGVIEACLNLDPESRPTPEQILETMSGKAMAETPKLAKKPSTTPAKKVATPVSRVQLTGENGETITVSIATELGTVFGKNNLSRMGEDAKFCNTEQFCIYQEAETEAWMIKPCPNTTNETLVDGRELLEPTNIVEGMEVSIGREAKGIKKLPMFCHITSEI